MIDDATKQKMKTIPWTIALSDEFEIEFRPDAEVCPANYRRPNFWEAQFVPRVWREEMPNYWKPIVVKLQQSIVFEEQEEFDEAMKEVILGAQAMAEELFHHVEDYLPTEFLKRFLAMRTVFQAKQLPLMVAALTNQHVCLNANPELRQAAVDRDESMCRDIIPQMNQEAPDLLGDTMLNLHISQKDDESAVWLLSLCGAVLGEEVADALWNGSRDRLAEKWREIGVEPVETEAEHLANCLSASTNDS